MPHPWGVEGFDPVDWKLRRHPVIENVIQHMSVNVRFLAKFVCLDKRDFDTCIAYDFSKPDSLLFGQPYLSIQNYPSELKKIITDKLVAFEDRSRKKSNKIQGIINLMNEADHSSRLNQTRDYIRRLDAERGTSFSKTFPELNRFLEI